MSDDDSHSGASLFEEDDAQSSDDWYEAIDIVAEKRGMYKVRWGGVNPETGKPWPDSWVPKKDCSDTLIKSWKAQQAEKKKAQAQRRKSRASNASSKSVKRSASTSTAATTRQLLPISETRDPPARAGPSRPSTSNGTAQKRPRTSRDSLGVDVDALPGPSRPRKMRKIEVEVVDSHSARSTPEHPFNAVEKQSGQKAIVKTELDRKGKRKASDNTDDYEPTHHTAVPITKRGPPRHLKRGRKSKPQEAPAEWDPSAHDDEDDPATVEPPLPQRDRASSPRNSNAASALPARKQPSRPTVNGKKSTGDHSRPTTSNVLAQLQENSESDDEALLNPSFLRNMVPPKNHAVPHLTTAVRQLLAQEEEENTQEAIGWIPSPPREPSVSPRSRQSTGLSNVNGAEAGPSRPREKVALQGRPSANDTFSREGIVPGTQQSVAPERHQDRHSSLHQDDVAQHTLPSTPVRAQSSSTCARTGSASSVKAKMKPKRTSTKELKPVPIVTPSVFRPHLPSNDIDPIEEFSSPETEKRRREARLNLPTQESIELAQFTQDQLDSFVDWEGGQPPDDGPPSPSEENQLPMSVGPQLPPTDDEPSPRQAMAPLFTKHSTSREEPSAEVAASPEIPLLQDFPPTSTTQRAEADSQSQLVLQHQIEELNATLGEKEEQLVQLEMQIEELQKRVYSLETEKAEEAATFEEELNALKEASEEKSEQITQLESQLVELQLQVTQLTSESEHERAQHESQIEGLRTSLEERDEQISQLEGALVELQTEIAELSAKNEALEAAQEQTADAQAAQLVTAHERVATLEQELAQVRRELLTAQDELAALSARLESTTKEWEQRYKYLEGDRDLFKNLYSEASTHAARLGKENLALEERATLAEGQTRDGLTMIRGTFEAQVRKLREEVTKWQGLCKVLQAKDERTNDELRRRAALEPDLRAENDRLKQEAEIIREDMERMAQIIARMTGQQDALGEEDAEGEEEEDTPAEQMAISSSDHAPLPPEDAEDMQLLYLCQYVGDGATMCRHTFASEQAVIEHARKIHYPGIDFSGLEA
ncbi:hypothetical protein GY45DRAFT_1326691 [Cubamyces sp. BRFM 1775]|nr:hypothetical protein GY45DRAFT_1326691 [Cubamyces sp. BRFM 1775]